MVSNYCSVYNLILQLDYKIVHTCVYPVISSESNYFDLCVKYPLSSTDRIIRILYYFTRDMGSGKQSLNAQSGPSYYMVIIYIIYIYILYGDFWLE